MKLLKIILHVMILYMQIVDNCCGPGYIVSLLEYTFKDSVGGWLNHFLYNFVAYHYFGANISG